MSLENFPEKGTGAIYWADFTGKGRIFLEKAPVFPRTGVSFAGEGPILLRKGSITGRISLEKGAFSSFARKGSMLAGEGANFC